MTVTYFPVQSTVDLRYLDARWHAVPVIPARELRRAVWRRSGRLCWLCHKQIARDGLTLDHVIPRRYFRRGWRPVHHFANFRPAHRECNQARGCRLQLAHVPAMSRALVAMVAYALSSMSGRSVV